MAKNKDIKQNFLLRSDLIINKSFFGLLYNISYIDSDPTNWGRYGFDVGAEALGAFRGRMRTPLKTCTCNWQRLRTCSLISRTLALVVVADQEQASLSN